MKQYRPKPRDETRRNMAAIRSRENVTEVTLRKRLHSMGFRYRKYRRDLPGCPDFVFVQEKIAVFIDGDYWHGRLLIEHGSTALKRSLRTPNRHYWLEKLKTNVTRDRQATRELRDNGWRVLRYWESDVRRNVEEFARRVCAAVVKQRRG